MSQQNRRTFLKTSLTASATVTAGPLILTQSASPNDRIVFATIGLGGRGYTLTRSFARHKDIVFASLSDPDSSRAGDLYNMLKSETNPDLKRESDFRRVIDNNDVDAIIVATPDHWHALPTIFACQAGKDVYVEKPASHNIWEGRKMVEAARKYKRIVQVGTQTRSAPYVHKAIEYLRSGALGTIPLCKVYNLKSGNAYSLGKKSTPPKEMDWDQWLGPASKRDYYERIPKGGWLYHWDFCGGDMGNDGVHQIDLARMLIDRRDPKSVYCTGGNLAYQDDREVPDTQVATFDYGDMIMTFEMTNYPPYMAKTPTEIRESDSFPYWPQNSTRIELYGTKNLMIIGRHGGGWQAFTDNGEVVAQEYGRIPDVPHRDNFIECIRSRERPNTDIEEGHHSAVLVHLGNIAYRLGGRKLEYDAEREVFTNDEEANRLLKRSYREPYSIPENV